MKKKFNLYVTKVNLFLVIEVKIGNFFTIHVLSWYSKEWHFYFLFINEVACKNFLSITMSKVPFANSFKNR